MYGSTEEHRIRVVTQNRSPSFPGCERLTVQGQASAAKPVNTGAAHNLPWHLVLEPVYNSQPDILQYIEKLNSLNAPNGKGIDRLNYLLYSFIFEKYLSIHMF